MVPRVVTASLSLRGQLQLWETLGFAAVGGGFWLVPVFASPQSCSGLRTLLQENSRVCGLGEVRLAISMAFRPRLGLGSRFSCAYVTGVCGVASPFLWVHFMGGSVPRCLLLISSWCFLDPRICGAPPFCSLELTSLSISTVLYSLSLEIPDRDVCWAVYTSFQV